MRGFTLVELMIAIAILAIVVALAVPAYRDYSVRSKVAECVNGAAVAKVQITEFRQTLGAWPPNAADAGLDTQGYSRYCNGFLNYSDGRFEIGIDEAAIDPIVTGELNPVMVPTINASNVVNWNCTRGATSIGNLKYLPATCRDSV